MSKPEKYENLNRILEANVEQLQQQLNEEAIKNGTVARLLKNSNPRTRQT